MAGTFTVTGMAAGLQSGQKTIGPLSAIGTSVVGTIVDLALSSGDNTVSIPTGAVAALIVFPSSTSATVKVRTNLDSSYGITLGNFSYVPWAMFGFSSSATSIILNSSATTGTIEVTFI